MHAKDEKQKLMSGEERQDDEILDPGNACYYYFFQ